MRHAGSAGSGGTEALTVGVKDRSPCFRDGLIAALRSEGFAARDCGDPLRWARVLDRPALVLAVDEPADRALVERVHRDVPGVVSVAVVPELGSARCTDVLRAGASSVVDRTAMPQDIVSVLSSAVRGTTLLPTRLVRELASRDPIDELPALPPQELHWVRRLAEGATVRALAAEAGYSERHMFRRLEGLYRRMGVRNRHEAVLRLASATSPSNLESKAPQALQTPASGV